MKYCGNTILRYALVGLFFSALTYILFVVSPSTYSTHNKRLSPQENEAVELINPTVTSGLDKHFIINFLPLRKEIEAIQSRFSQKTLVYFLYLNNGSWIGVNERENFTAASTAKIPLAMAVYKAVEEGKIDLDDVYALDKVDLDAGFGALYQIGSNNELTIKRLIEIMLVHSDNTAKNALISSLNRIGIEDPFSDVYRFFGWISDIGEVPDFSKINLKTLSNMFVSLYNATYVSVENSAQILSYLAQSEFDSQIVAGVPEDIPVAHKIGVSAVDNTFSDCGLVYAPQRHYLLCMASIGASEAGADRFMSEISRAIYQYVIKN